MSKTTAEIRSTFLQFFNSKGHEIVASSSLVPNNDPTLLFTNAGMNQFKDVFLGQDQRDYSRATTSQRCVRAGGKHNDLENVGYTARHHTFFEMLGNFSFGDYFKHQAIAYAWELLTSADWFALPAERLWVTVYHNDDEAYRIWNQDIGIPAARIIRIGDNKGSAYASDNFWQMGDTGPCGPCSEIFYDHGDHISGGPPGSAEEDGDRYIEIWNIVFMQFNRQPDGTMQPLPKPSVDTGMGLERISAVLQHVHSNYDIDLFQQLIKAAAQVTGSKDFSSKSLRVIADHIRSSAFLIADGVLPSNENRGYVLRRIIRRAVRHGNMSGASESFFWKLVAPLVEVMGEAGEHLRQQQQHVESVLKAEEEQFAKTLERGLSLLDQELAKLIGDTLDGQIVFKLYDTFGFPIDLTADVCREKNIKIDEQGFDNAMQLQRERARQASGFTGDYSQQIRIEDPSQFDGYQHLSLSSTISAMFIDGQQVNELHAGQKALIILHKTPFYGESGGQTGDTGTIVSENASFTVEDTQKYGVSPGHIGLLTDGVLRTGQQVTAQVDGSRRARIRLNHSATHLLHAALRQVLGEHVTQKGSLVNDKYLRFDFAHSGSISEKQLEQVALLVNQQIQNNLKITTEIMDIEAAKQSGAMALFGEKYDQKVRVLKMGNFSTELCGGTHASRTGDIGLFLIQSESGTAAGVRRIEAITGELAIRELLQRESRLRQMGQLLKATPHNLDEKVKQTVEQVRSLEKELQHLQDKQAAQASASLAGEAIDWRGAKVLVSQIASTEPKLLRTMVDDLKNQLGTAVIILATVYDGKAAVIAGVTKDLTRKIEAGKLVSQVACQLGGKGGGRPDMAQAGGIDLNAIPKALSEILTFIKSEL